MKLLYRILLITFFASACNTKEEKEKALADLNLNNKASIEVKKQIEKEESKLMNYTSEFEVALDKISSAKEIQFLRTTSEREAEIKQAVEYKLKIEKKIETIKNTIQFYTDSLMNMEIRIRNIEEKLKG